MRPDPRFLRQPKSFWANVRTLGQHIGYTTKGRIKTPSIREMRHALAELRLNADAVGTDREPSALGAMLLEYFLHRANVLENFVEPSLMDADAARALFEETRARLQPRCAIPMNNRKVQ